MLPVPSKTTSTPHGAHGLQPCGWVAPEDIDLATWLVYGRRLGTVGRGVAWWIGDWLRYGNGKYGEKYSRAARVTGYDVQSLTNMVYVASRFELPRRREQLSWSHHAEVAPLEQRQQDHWLAMALEQRLSVHSLRQELRALRAATRSIARGERPLRRRAASDHVVCPYCHGVITSEPGAA